MVSISEQIMFVNFKEKEQIKHDEIFIIQNNDFEILNSISMEYKTIALININLSSHFMNIVRKKLGIDKYRFILGGDKLKELIDNTLSDLIVDKEHNIIKVENIEYIFNKFDSYANVSYDIDFNLLTKEYCMRPKKKYGNIYLQIMASAMEGFHGKKCHIIENQVWFSGGLLPSELYEWCLQNFDLYLQELHSSLSVFRNIFLMDGMDDKISCDFLSSYYQYTDYIGSITDVVSYKIWNLSTPEKIFILQTSSSLLFTLDDNIDVALKVIELLQIKLCCENELITYCNERVGQKCNREECLYFVMNIMSDIRRKAMITLRNVSGYIDSIARGI